MEKITLVRSVENDMKIHLYQLTTKMALPVGDLVQFLSVPLVDKMAAGQQVGL